MKKADIGVALYVLAAFVMLIVPISSVMLDVLLACNIAVAFAVLFSTMYAKEVLDLSSLLSYSITLKSKRLLWLKRLLGKRLMLYICGLYGHLK